MDVLFNPVDPAFLADPYPTYARLRDEGSVHLHPGGFAVVSRYEDVSYVLRNAEIFSSSAMGGGGRDPRSDGPSRVGGSLISQDPPIHGAQRAIVNRGFTPRRISEFRARVSQVVDELMAELVPRGRCDLTDEFAAPLPVRMIAELLGLGDDRLDDLKRWSSTLIVGSTSADGPGGSAVMEATRAFEAYMTDHVEQRRIAPGSDLVSTLIDAGEGQGVLSASEVVSFASLLLAAGSETTMNLIGNATLALLADPDLYARVRSDLSTVPTLLEESLRRDSPVQMVMRLSTQDTEIGGVAIPKGRLVMALLASANRDSAQFPDPDRFDLDRNTARHVGFGLGNHFCLGAALARLEAQLALEAILTHLPELALDLPDSEAIAYHGSFLIRGPKALPVRYAS